MGGAGGRGPRDSPAAAARRDAIPLGRVGDVAWRRLADAPPQRCPLQRQATRPVLDHPAGLARARRQRLVAPAPPAVVRPPECAPARAARGAAPSGAGGRAGSAVSERPALGHLLHAAPVRHAADRLRAGGGRRNRGGVARTEAGRLARLRHRPRPGRAEQGTGRAGPRAAGGAASTVVGGDRSRRRVATVVSRRPGGARLGDGDRARVGAARRRTRGEPPIGQLSSGNRRRAESRGGSREGWGILARGGGIS
jgi:hypothetical protein